MSRLKKAATASLSQPEHFYQSQLPTESLCSGNGHNYADDWNNTTRLVVKAEKETGDRLKPTQSQGSSDDNSAELDMSAHEPSPTFDDALPNLPMQSPSLSDTFFRLEASNQVSPQDSNEASPVPDISLSFDSPCHTGL